MRQDTETENFRTLKAAEAEYERRRGALVARGYTFSNMDPIFRLWESWLNVRTVEQASQLVAADSEEDEEEPEE